MELFVPGVHRLWYGYNIGMGYVGGDIEIPCGQAGGIAILHPLADKRELQHLLEMTIKMVSRDQFIGHSAVSRDDLSGF